MSILPLIYVGSPMPKVGLTLMQPWDRLPSPEPKTSRFGPIQVFFQELEGPHAMNGVGAVKEFEFGAVPDAEPFVQAADFGEFVGNPLIPADTIAVTALDHE